jgi:4-amino-4-deoxy-L-arabinose transferase-like glycosyltransferase
MVYVGLLLFAVLHFRSIGNMNVETDFYWTYVPIAKALLSGELVLDAFRGPGYEIVLAALRLVVGEFFRAGLILSVLSSGVTLLLLYAVLHKTFGAEAALLTSVGTALTPAFFSLSYTAGTDMFYVMLALSVLFLILRGGFTRGWMLLLAGLLAGYAYLTRYNGIAIIVAAGASILWLCDPSLPWKRRIRSAALFLAGALATIVPFSFYTHHLTGRFVYNNNFLNVAFEVYAKGIRWDDYWNVIAPHFHSYAEVVAYDPWKFILHVGMNVFTHGWADLTSLVLWPVGIGAAVGGVFMLRSGLTRQQAAVMLFAVLSFLVLIPVFYTQRFSLFLVPFIVLLFVRFLQWRGTQRIPERWFRYATRAIAIVLALWVGLQSAYLLKQDIASEPTEILLVRDAFKGLTDDSPRGKSITARKPHIAHYLDLAYTPFPYVTSEADLVSALRQGNVDYVYISTYEVATRPELKGLLDSTREHEGLSALITVLSPPSVLYRVTP